MKKYVYVYLRSNNYISMRRYMLEEVSVERVAEAGAMEKQDDRVRSLYNWCNN